MMNTTTEVTDAAPAITGEDLRNHPAVVRLRHRLATVHGGNKAALSRELGTSDMSTKTITGLLEGTYGGNVAGKLAILEERLPLLDARQTVPGVDLDHIPTELGQRVAEVCHAARETHLINIIAGRSQIGKTTAAEAYALRYPASTILMRMPTRPTISSMLHELTASAGLPRSRSNAEAIARLRAHLQPHHLIIVDEAHLALDRVQGVDALDQLRELWDRNKCGMVLMVTDTRARDMVKGEFSGRLYQLEYPGEWENLPPVPTQNDVAAIWQAYGLPAPDEKTMKAITVMVKASCFGRYCHRMKWAAALAKRTGQQLSWGFFLEATKQMDWRPV